MAQQVSSYEYVEGTTTNALVKTWLDTLTIASVLGTWTVPKSNTRATLYIAYKDA